MGYENKDQKSVDSATSSQGSNQTAGNYLFGDYSPFEENKNIIDMLKDFVSNLRTCTSNSWKRR